MTTDESARPVSDDLGPEFEWWLSAIAGKNPPIHPDQPECGFFVMRRKGEEDIPVAIYYGDDGRMIADIGFYNNDFGEQNVKRASEIWTRVCNHPITQERYWQAMDAGAWPDGIGAIPTAKGSVMGDNLAEEDKAAALQDLVDAASSRVDGINITNDDELAGAQSLRARLLELKRDGEAHHEIEKRPHLEAGRAVDGRWNPIIRKAEDAAKGIVDKMRAWENAKREKAAAERRAAEAEQRRLEAEAAELNRPAPEPLPEAVPPPSAPLRGAYGRAASVKTVTVVDKITDIGALAKHFEADGKLIELLTKLANAQLKVGVTPPGVETKQDTSIK